MKERMSSKTWLIFFGTVVALSMFSAHAGDPDITSDFILPPGSSANPDFFTFRGFREPLSAGRNSSFQETKATEAEFPALNGQSVSVSVLQFAPMELNPPHTHPRSAELLIVLTGSLSVGFVDSNNKLYTQFLNSGDAFLFPKGLVHFHVNKVVRYDTVAISIFSSANPGTVSLPKTLFGSGIYDWLLAQSFKTDVDTINKIIVANSG